MQIHPQTNISSTSSIDQLQIKLYYTPLTCILFIISSLLFEFENDKAAIVFGGIFFAFALLLLFIKIFTIFLCRDNKFLPQNLQKIKLQSLSIVLSLITNILFAINSQTHDDVVKALSTLSFISSIICTFYLTVVLAKKQILLNQAENRRVQNIMRHQQQNSVANIMQSTGPVDCSICISIIRSIDRFIKLGCGHKFHDICFQGWARRKCPNCNCTF